MNGDTHGQRRASAEHFADGAVVTLEKGVPIAVALRRLKRRTDQAGVLRELAHRRAGVTVAGRRKLKARRAVKRLRRDAIRANGHDERE